MFSVFDRSRTHSYVSRSRDWDSCAGIIGKPLHEFLNTRFSQLNHRGKFSILEVGCGKGNICHQLGHLYPNVTIVGIDVEGSSSISIHDKPVFLQANIQQYRLKNAFDCIIGISVLPYVKDKLSALLNIWDSLKLHGIAVLSVQPYHFGPYALEMFADGDIKWDHERQALVIYKSSLEKNAKILPCLKYECVDYIQSAIATDEITVNLWPSFLAYPTYYHPLSERLVQQRPYNQAVVSLCVEKNLDLTKAQMDFVFNTKDFYPALMVTNPNSKNRRVEYKTFIPLGVTMLSPDVCTPADELSRQKKEWKKLYDGMVCRAPNPSWNCVLKCQAITDDIYGDINHAELAVEKFLRSEGKVVLTR